MTKIAREMLEEAKANYNAETGEGAGYLMEAYLFYLEETRKLDKKFERVN